jgi:hypothetical protein
LKDNNIDYTKDRKLKYIHPVNTRLTDKENLENFKYLLLDELFTHWRYFQDNEYKIITPDIVKMNSKKYLNNNDILYTFLNENIKSVDLINKRNRKNYDFVEIVKD